VRVMGPAHVEDVVEQACRTALAYRQPTHVMIPVDFQSQPVKDRSERNVAHHVSNVMARGGQLPDPEMLQRAADILNKAEKPFILAGRGAIGATQELLAVAERLQAPIGKPLLGKQAVPDESPYTTGGVGLLGTKPSQEALESCDTLLIVGSTFPYIEFYPAPGKAKAVQIDIDPKRIGMRYPVDAGLVGDSHPDRQVVAIIGDGSAAMLMGDFVTLRKYNLNAKIIVIKNNALGQIKWEQMVFLGNPEYGCELEPIDFARVAEGCGIGAVTIEDPARCGDQLREALATPGPCLIEAVVDPYEPPMPPKVEVKQAMHMAEALAKGTPHAMKTALTLASDTVRELV
jgi:thiamine pyrophosphate-dependent acetolactate synthase large subunit-like protein